MGSLVFYVAALLVVTPVLGIKYTDCGSGSTVTDVEVAGCEGKDVCPLKRGTSVHLTIKFKSKSSSNALSVVVHGIIAGVPMPFPAPQPDGCVNSGINCPLKSGEDYTYTADLPVKNSYPPLQVMVKWEIKDPSSGDVVCLKIPSKID